MTMPPALAQRSSLTCINPLANNICFFLCLPFPVLRHRSVTLSRAFPDGAVGWWSEGLDLWGGGTGASNRRAPLSDSVHQQQQLMIVSGSRYTPATRALTSDPWVTRPLFDPAPIVRHVEKFCWLWRRAANSQEQIIVDEVATTSWTRRFH